MHQNPVFRLKRDDVGHGPEGDEVEPLAQIEIRQRSGLEKAWQSLKTIPTLQR